MQSRHGYPKKGNAPNLRIHQRRSRGRQKPVPRMSTQKLDGLQSQLLQAGQSPSPLQRMFPPLHGRARGNCSHSRAILRAPKIPGSSRISSRRARLHALFPPHEALEYTQDPKMASKSRGCLRPRRACRLTTRRDRGKARSCVATLVVAISGRGSINLRGMVTGVFTVMVYPKLRDTVLIRPISPRATTVGV